MGLTIKEVVGELKTRKEKDSDFIVQKKDINVLNNGTGIAVKGKEYAVDDIGKSTLCAALGMPRSYFKRYPVHSEFSEHANTLLKTKPQEELLARTRGDQLRALLHPKYVVYDNDKVLEALQRVEGDLPNYKLGILKSNPLFSIFMLTFGTSVVKQNETYPMIRFSNSEVGLSSLTMEMGLFSVQCTNGLVRKQADYGYINWWHTPRNEHKIGIFVNFVISNGIGKWSQMQKLYEEATTVKITRPFKETVYDLCERSRITERFSKKLVEESNATPVQTKYDAIYMITRKAQEEKTWEGQTRYENLASDLLENKIPC